MGVSSTNYIILKMIEDIKKKLNLSNASIGHYYITLTMIDDIKQKLNLSNASIANDFGEPNQGCGLFG